MSDRDEEKVQKEQKDRDEKERKNDLRKQINVEHVWNQVDINEDRIDPGIDARPGWKTVRIFVSSTFKDFHQEREILTKEVFADLRAWCEERQLHLIDCDLRWGVPKETTSEVTLRTCLEEIDRCYACNKVPYFVNMTCKRVGWIPLDEELPPNLLSNYRLVFGLSVTEMEIVHAAYRIENPNALFLIRDDAFLNEIEDVNVRNEFIDELQPVAEEKLQVLKDKITSRFPDRVVHYKCQYIKDERLYTDYTGEKGRPKLKLDEDFSKKVLKFFKERIAQQYPEVNIESDHYQEAKYRHEAFMRSRSEVVLGREDILEEIANYITSDLANYPKVVVGEAGVGKSSIIAKAVSETLQKIEKNQLSCTGRSSGRDWTVFYHFVGAVPNSTNMLEILRRLLNELQPDQEVPETLKETMEVIKCELSRDFQKPIIIFIDALNQIDRDVGMEMMFWLPEKLSHNVRCILSLKSFSEAYAALRRHRFPLESETSVPDLLPKTRIEIVNNYLGLFNKKLEGEQLAILIVKNSSRNPLWLQIACEELRIYGDFSTITGFMEKLEDGLPNLVRQVLQRFEKETDKALLISTLCLLEVSKYGLLECELLEILADKEHLEYRESNREDKTETRVKEKGRHLPAMEWVAVYRNLRFFLRPFGNPSEGRLDFYHRMLSEVVREMYLTDKYDAQSKDRLWWWHKKLADFYSRSGTYDRKVEEYPYHLIRLQQNALNDVEKQRYCKQLENFLLDMGVFKRLYDHEFSGALLYYWRQSGDESYDKMTRGYMDAWEEMKNDATYTKEQLAEKCEDFSRLLVQAGKYKEGLELADECMLLLKHLDDGPIKQEKLAFLYGHVAHIRSVSAKEIPELEEIIQLHEDAIQIIRDIGLDRKDKKNKLTECIREQQSGVNSVIESADKNKYLALMLIKKAFARGSIATCCESFPTSLSGLSKFFNRKTTKKEMTDQGLKEVDEAIRIYREIKDFGHELEAQLTMATLNRGDKEKQLEIYKSTRERCCQIFGKDHPLMCSLCFNTAIAYEDAKETEEAYKFFREAYDISMRVFGPEHAMTENYRSTLKDGIYECIGRRLGHRLD